MADTASEMLGAPSKRRRLLAGSSLIFHFLLFNDTAFSINNGPMLAVCVSRVETMHTRRTRVLQLWFAVFGEGSCAGAKDSKNLILCPC